MQQMGFTQEAYDEIMNSVGKLPVETGGILLGNRDDFIVQKFVFDNFGSRSSSSYDPDIVSLNKTIKKEWEENGLALIGFVHSHPRGVSRLSGDWGNNTGDIGYIKAIFKAISGLDKFLVPIVYSSHDGGESKIFPYMARRGIEEHYAKLDLNIIPENVSVKAPVKKSLLSFPIRKFSLSSSKKVELKDNLTCASKYKKYSSLDTKV